MLDFLVISTRSGKRGIIEIYPKFIIRKSSDLMIRGGDFYAIWIEERGLWSTDEQDAVDLIDRELDRYAEETEGALVEIAARAKERGAELFVLDNGWFGTRCGEI